MKRETLVDAVAYVAPKMTDTRDVHNDATKLLNHWAASKLTIAAASATTLGSFREAFKDKDAARGKVVCFEGRVMSIEKVTGAYGDKFFSGMIGVVGPVQTAFFSAHGSTGSIVGGDHPQLCGVITGFVTYENRDHAEVVAAEIVGMFNIRENWPASK